MPSVTLSDAEVRRLLTGRLLVVRPLPKANEIDSDGTVLTADAVCPARVSGYIPWFGRNIHDSEALVEFTKQQYEHGIPNPLGAPGDVLACKEAWGIADMFLLGEYALAEFNSGKPSAAYTGKIPGHYELDEFKDHVVYRANRNRPFYWRPASTMPAWAVRLRPVVIEAGVMRAGGMTREQIDATGLAEAISSLTDRSFDHWEDEACRLTKLVNRWSSAVTRKAEYGAMWNRRFRKYPWESNPFAWWALVEVKEQNA